MSNKIHKIVNKMNGVLFSILIANYNNGTYLMEAIESVRKQTYPHWEIVLVDDASTDNSEELYAELEKDERIHIYRNEQNRGCTYTKAKCIKMAAGDICGFLDADDKLYRNALEVMVDIHKDATISIVSSRHEYIDEKSRGLGISRLLSLKTSYLESRDYGPEHFVAFKKSFYTKTKGLDITHKVGDDQELYLLLEEVGEWKVLDAVLYQYRVHGNSIGHTNPHCCNFWNMIVRYEACARRGLDPEKYPLQDYLEAIALERTLSADSVITNFRTTSKAYKIGKLFLRPLKWLK